MSQKVGLVRSAYELEAAAHAIQGFKRQLADAQPPRVWGKLLGYYQLSMMLDAAGAITGAALSRKESLGAHFRQDG